MFLTKSLLHTTDAYVKKLKEVGIETVRDLLLCFPRDIEDKSDICDRFSMINIKEKQVIKCTIELLTSETTRNKKLLIKAVLTDRDGSHAEAVWFNRRFLLQQYARWDTVLIYGMPKYEYGKLSFPSCEIEHPKETRREIVPVYSDINYIPGTWIRGKIVLLKEYIREIPDEIPESIRKKKSMRHRQENILAIHFPHSLDDFERAKWELGYEELFHFQKRGLEKKYELLRNSEWRSPMISLDTNLIKELINSLPYTLTDKQKIVLFQILKDMEKPHAMARMLQGDVGTGKTIVTLLAAIHMILVSRWWRTKNGETEGGKLFESEWKQGSRRALASEFLSASAPFATFQWRKVEENHGSENKNNLQVAIMAPTEILARQHFSGSEAWLMELWIQSDLLVGSLTPRMKEEARERLRKWETDIIFGTHALIQDEVRFAKLGFVVVDEQHRFGVEQRKALEEYCSRDVIKLTSYQVNTDKPPTDSWKPENSLVPHRLNMSATPIPRSLALTLYGDQDISVLDEYPAGRKPIHTKVVREDRRNEVYRWIDEQVTEWRQVYWISPLVEESETLDIASATNMQEILTAIFPNFSVWLIHGKMTGKEKDRIMQDFYENKIQILSSTSVVEVWVNNPNASIICIEAAERFGLSSLHQFRGRVGRGEHQSYCYLFTTKEYKTDRLKAMEQTNDGFELAQIDLDLRGPGEVYGVRQSGVPDMHFASLRDTDLIAEIREDIEEWMKWK